MRDHLLTLSLRRYIPRDADGGARQELQDQRHELRHGWADSSARELPSADSAGVWVGSGGGFAGVQMRVGMPTSQMLMHSGPVHEHQQRINDLSHQIERIQQIMNELNLLRLPNEIMLQLSDYITHLRKELHRLNLAVQSSQLPVSPMSAAGMEQHGMRRDPIARDGARGDATHFSPRQDVRGDSGGKRLWRKVETGGGVYIEREAFVSDDRGGDADAQHDGHGFGASDDYGKRGR